MPTAHPHLLRRLTVGVVSGALLLAGCTDAQPSEPEPSDVGDTLSALSLGPVDTWDPQRLSSPADTAFAGRTWLRTLTAYAPGTSSRLVGDLATDTGTVDKTLKVWSFTLRDGVRWQDGSEVTCEDVAYGISRGFAADLSGPGDAAAVLDIPRDEDGTSTYAGPFSGTGQDAYDKAVTCEGRTLTVHLALPRPDFDEQVTRPSFAPFKKAQDRRADSRYAAFSTGPYLLQDPWEPSAGGTWVRNPHWDVDTDPVRGASVREIRYQEGLETQTAIQRVMADAGEDRASVALAPAPPALQQQINSSPELTERTVSVPDDLVDYLAPVWTSPVMKKPKARAALAVSTNRAAYVTALGGSRSALPAFSVLPASIPGHSGDDPSGAGAEGDADRSRDLLTEAGFTLPVPLRVAYRSGETADKAMAALQAGWEAGGFEVTLQPIADDYFPAVSKASRADSSDVIWANWAPAWASASTVLPVLFDSRLNLSDNGSGRDLGRYDSAVTNKEISRINTVPDRDEREQAWGKLDRSLASEGAYIALAQRRNVFIAGSGVRSLQTSAVLGGVVDLADVGLR